MENEIPKKKCGCGKKTNVQIKPENIEQIKACPTENKTSCGCKNKSKKIKSVPKPPTVKQLFAKQLEKRLAKLCI